MTLIARAADHTGMATQRLGIATGEESGSSSTKNWELLLGSRMEAATQGMFSLL